jgi:hypothetical protein
MSEPAVERVSVNEALYKSASVLTKSYKGWLYV